MAISKALRFEVLRRDGFACRYCGGRAPEVQLQVDHVKPVSLGGRDEPENIVTSCADCNWGKGSTPPSGELVADVADDAERWAAAMQLAVAEASAAIESEDLRWFEDAWNAWHWGADGPHRRVPLPADWRRSVRGWQARGLTRTLILEMVDVAMSRDHIPAQETFAYFAGCCWNQLRTLQDRAAQLLASAGTPE